MRLATKEVIKSLSDSVKIYEIEYRDGETLYNVEVNGSPNVILHLNYMEAYQEAREAVK